jgi:acyl carrier protein
MSQKTQKILNNLSKILEKKNLKPSDNISSLKEFDSIIILQIINMCNMTYKKKIDGLQISKSKKISDIINLIEKK